MLHLETVEPDTLELLRDIQRNSVFEGLRLVGGTALALQIGHRNSVDLDFFGYSTVSGFELEQALRAYGTVSLTSRSRLVEVYTVRGIKVDFVEYAYPWIDPLVISDCFRLASVRDIAAMKLSAITNRGTKKDFVDLAFLLERLSLDEMFALYKSKYADASLFLALKSLTFFDDAEEDPMPRMFKPCDWEAVKQSIIRSVSQVVVSTFPEP